MNLAIPKLTNIIDVKQIGLLVAILALSAVMTILNPEFLHFENVRNILQNISIITIAGVGISLVILTGEVDISIGSQQAIAATLSAMYIQAGGHPLVAVVIAVAAGAVLGFVNGMLIHKTGIHSIIITLGMMTILRGLNILVLDGRWITDLPYEFWLLGNLRILQLPIPVWAMFISVGSAAVLLRRTNFGRDIYLTGDNINAARISGINTGRVKVIAFTVLGSLVGLSGVLTAARFGWVMTNMGQGFEFRVIGAAIVGGISIFGGVGSVLGMFLGSTLMGIIPNALVLIRVPTTWERTILGMLILIAVVSDSLLKNRRRRSA